MAHAVADLLLRALADLQAKRDVLPHGQVLEGRVVLEDEADAALLRSQPRRLLLEDENVARVGLLKARDDPQQRRFATAAGTQQGRERAGWDVEGDIVEGDEVPEPLANVPDCDGH